MCVPLGAAQRLEFITAFVFVEEECSSRWHRGLSLSPPLCPGLSVSTLLLVAFVCKQRSGCAVRASCESLLALEQPKKTLRHARDAEPVRRAEGPPHSTRLLKIPIEQGAVERRWFLMHRRIRTNVVAVERMIAEREHASRSGMRRHDAAPAASIRCRCAADVTGHFCDGGGRFRRCPEHRHIATHNFGDVAAAARHPLVRRQAHVGMLPAAGDSHEVRTVGLVGWPFGGLLGFVSLLRRAAGRCSLVRLCACCRRSWRTTRLLHCRQYGPAEGWAAEGPAPLARCRQTSPARSTARSCGLVFASSTSSIARIWAVWKSSNALCPETKSDGNTVSGEVATRYRLNSSDAYSSRSPTKSVDACRMDIT